MRFSLPEACRKTGIPYSRAYSAIVRGAVPAERIKSGWMIAESDLAILAAVASTLPIKTNRLAA